MGKIKGSVQDGEQLDNLPLLHWANLNNWAIFVLQKYGNMFMLLVQYSLLVFMGVIKLKYCNGLY